MRRLQKNESAIIDWKCCIKLSAGIFMEHHHKRLTAVLTGSFCHCLSRRFGHDSVFNVMQITKVKMMKVSLIERKLLLVLFFFKEKKRELTPMATTISNANRTVLRIGSGVNGRKEAGCGHVKNISGY